MAIDSTQTLQAPVDRSVQRIVVVDDDDDVRQLVRLNVEVRRQFDVVAEAANGADALVACVAERPDIIVLDLGLPDIAGQDLLARLRDAVPTARIVVFTGYSEPSSADVVGWGAVALVRKDQRIAALVRALEAAAAESLVARCRLPRAATSAGAARDFVSSTLETWGYEHLAYDATLIASELVTNAVIHAATPCTLLLRLGAGVLRVEVTDGGGGSPELRTPARDEVGKQGLRIVATLATAWGIDPLRPGGKGKSVWAELAASPIESPA